MSTISKILIALVLVCVAAAGIAFLTSRYLVSKLDGTGGVQTPQAGMQVFEDARMGLRFLHADVYEASVQQTGSAGREWYAVVLLPDGYVPPQNGEGPPAITVQSDLPNPEAYDLRDWIRASSYSNLNLERYNDQGEQVKLLTVAGYPAVSYENSGLYETTVVAVQAKGKIYLFEAGWMSRQDRIISDFEKLLTTVQFTDGQ